MPFKCVTCAHWLCFFPVTHPTPVAFYSFLVVNPCPGRLAHLEGEEKESTAMPLKPHSDCQISRGEGEHSCSHNFQKWLLAV